MEVVQEAISNSDLKLISIIKHYLLRSDC